MPTVLQNGVSAGKQAGFTEGWNAAIRECNPMIEERDREIARLSGEIHCGQCLHRGAAHQSGKGAARQQAIPRRTRRAEHAYRQEKAKRERLQYLVNIAREHGVNVEAFDK